MHKHSFIRHAITVSLALIAIQSHSQTAEEHTSFCYQTSSNSTLLDKGSNGNCAAILTGGLAAVWFADRLDLIPVVLSGTEHQIADLALPLACKDSVSKQIAIRLLQVCQCHNPGAQDSIDSNQKEVLKWVSDHSNYCP